MILRVHALVKGTCVDGTGLRTSIYFSGCNHHCKGCHNPQTWNVNNGDVYTIDELLDIIKEEDFNVTFSGGDPFYQCDGVTELARRIKAETDKTIWCYTGYTLEQIIGNDWLKQMLPYIDVLVDGPFIEELKTEEIPFVGSSNQRVIYLKD